MTPWTLGRAAALGGFVAWLTACVVEHDRSNGYMTGASAAPAPSGGTGGSAAPQPVLVTVDTGKTMNADPGDGVGVFVEYAAGGHWSVWWTCDTVKTGQSCVFDVHAEARSGALTNAQGYQLLDGDTASAPSSQEVVAHTTTTTAVTGIAFDSDPGAIVTLNATIGGVADPAYFFFVQDGQVNGGFQGKLTNPLMFQGSAP